MSNLLFLVATDFLAFVCLTSALAKTIQKPDPFRSYQHWALALLNTRWFPLLEFGAGAILLLPAPMIVQACAAIGLAIVVTAGEILHARHPEVEAEGFGSVTPDSTRQYFALDVAVLATTALVAFMAVRTPLAHVPVNAWLTGITIAILIGVAGKLRYDQSSGKGYAKKSVDLAQVNELPATLFLGTDARGPLNAGDLVALGRATVILAVAPHDSPSRDAYAVLANHARLLSKDLTIVVIAQNDELFRNNPNAPMRQLIDPASCLSRFLGLRVRPYAILLDDHLSLQAPPSQTSHTIQRLITLLVNMIKNAPESYLTDGQDVSREES